jgi:hypothetical protein
MNEDLIRITMEMGDKRIAVEIHKYALSSLSATVFEEMRTELLRIDQEGDVSAQRKLVEEWRKIDKECTERGSFIGAFYAKCAKQLEATLPRK